MASTGISFFYEKDKANILKAAAKADDGRTTSSYIQKVLQEHIDKVSTPTKKKRIIVRRRKNG